MIIFLMFCVSGDMHKALLLHINVRVLSQKSICAIVWAVNWDSGFFSCNTILTGNNNWQTMAIQNWDFSGHFRQNKQSEPVTSEKTTCNIYCQ